MISKVLEHLYIGDMQDVQNEADLQELGINAVFCVVETEPRGWTRQMKYALIPLEMMEKPENSPQWMHDICNWIEQAMKYGNVVVHCGAGIERSPTVVAVYLMRKRNMTLEDAVQHLKEARPQFSRDYVEQKIKEHPEWLK